MKYIVRFGIAIGVEADSPEEALEQAGPCPIEDADWDWYEVEEGDIMEEE